MFMPKRMSLVSIAPATVEFGLPHEGYPIWNYDIATSTMTSVVGVGVPETALAQYVGVVK